MTTDLSHLTLKDARLIAEISINCRDGVLGLGTWSACLAEVLAAVGVEHWAVADPEPPEPVLPRVRHALLAALAPTGEVYEPSVSEPGLVDALRQDRDRWRIAAAERPASPATPVRSALLAVLGDRPHQEGETVFTLIGELSGRLAAARTRADRADTQVRGYDEDRHTERDRANAERTRAEAAEARVAELDAAQATYRRQVWSLEASLDAARNNARDALEANEIVRARNEELESRVAELETPVSDPEAVRAALLAAIDKTTEVPMIDPDGPPTTLDLVNVVVDQRDAARTSLSDYMDGRAHSRVVLGRVRELLAAALGLENPLDDESSGRLSTVRLAERVAARRTVQPAPMFVLHETLHDSEYSFPVWEVRTQGGQLIIANGNKSNAVQLCDDLNAEFVRLSRS